jgi:hypothetical protein
VDDRSHAASRRKRPLAWMVLALGARRTGPASEATQMFHSRQRATVPCFHMTGKRGEVPNVDWQEITRSSTEEEGPIVDKGIRLSRASRQASRY